MVETKYKDYYVNREGQVISTKRNKKKILVGSISNKGYRRVLVSNNGKTINVSVHRLIAEVFIENKLNKSQVNHIDGNKLNNSVQNLEWCTPSENIKHSFKNGLSKISKDTITKATAASGRAKAKFTIDEASEIMEMKERLNLSARSVAALCGCEKTTILRIQNNSLKYYKEEVV